MELSHQLLQGRVMHRRHETKDNAFSYGIYYLSLPAHARAHPDLAHNRAGAISFHDADHGPKTGADLGVWIDSILKDADLNGIIDKVQLIAMPRVLGYVFNPVSFWMCFDAQRELRAVICEVNNTFGETHNYLCAHADKSPIDGADWLCAEKVFHVSPFMTRDGQYKFRFSIQGDKIGIWINLLDDAGALKLTTALTGRLSPLTKSALRRAFWRYPLVTLKAITLIHWQALKLFLKGIKYISKPPQTSPVLTYAKSKEFAQHTD
jgi:hypothetical protein